MVEDVAPANEPILIRGLVIPAGWDEKGRVKSVKISAFDETDYEVENGAGSRDLLKLVRREVEVVGWVDDLTDGVKRIRVGKCRSVGAEVKV